MPAAAATPRGAGTIRRFFPGAHTAHGFYSFYQEIAPGEAHRVLILKGGPGSGKSHLMEEVGEHLRLRGHDVELYHAPLDPATLDAVEIPALRIALIDGAASPGRDPLYPGAVDTILDLNRFCRQEKLRPVRDEIVYLREETDRHRQRAYRYLRLALMVHEELENYLREAGSLDIPALNEVAAEMLDEIFAGAPLRLHEPTARHFFASAITHRGVVHHFDSLFAGLARRIILQGQPGTGRSTLVRRVADRALGLGYDVELFHDALDPRQVEHLIIPDLGIAVVNGSAPHGCRPRPGDRLVETDNFLRRKRLDPYRSYLDDAHRRYRGYLERAVSFLIRAKATRDLLREYYLPCMDWAALDAQRERLLQDLVADGGAGR